MTPIIIHSQNHSGSPKIKWIHNHITLRSTENHHPSITHPHIMFSSSFHLKSWIVTSYHEKLCLSSKVELWRHIIRIRSGHQTSHTTHHTDKAVGKLGLGQAKIEKNRKITIFDIWTGTLGRQCRCPKHFYLIFCVSDIFGHNSRWIFFCLV